MFDSLLARASQNDAKAMMALVDLYNSPRQMGQILKKFFTAEEPQMSQVEQVLAGQGTAAPQGPPPSPQDVMSLLGGG